MARGGRTGLSSWSSWRRRASRYGCVRLVARSGSSSQRRNGWRCECSRCGCRWSSKGLAKCTVAQSRLEDRNRSSRQDSVAINQFPHHTSSLPFLPSLHRPAPFLLESRLNVRPAVSSSSGGPCPTAGIAAASRRLKKRPAIRKQCDTQLLRRVESHIFWSIEPGVKVSAAIGSSMCCADNTQTSWTALANPHLPCFAMAQLWYACTYTTARAVD